MIDQPAVGLDELLSPAVVAAEREAWIGRLAAATLQTLDMFTRQGFAAFRGWWRALAAHGALQVLIVEDLHWADDSSLDLLQHLGR